MHRVQSDECELIRNVRELGAGLEKQWRFLNYDSDIFSELATSALRQSKFDPDLDITKVITTILSEPGEIPAHKFSDMSLRIFNCPHFFIELLVWLDGTTVIHEHAFSGAFLVVVGNSVHSEFQFESTDRLSDRLIFGNPVFLDSEILRRGDIRSISPGRGRMHSLFHVARPSMTLVVRSHSEPKYYPQMEIRPPYLAIDSKLENDERVLLALRSINTLLRYDEDSAIQTLDELVTILDFPRLLTLLSNLTAWSYVLDEKFCKLLRAEFGVKAESIPDALKAMSRRDRFSALRMEFTSADDRFLLALLATVPSRSCVYRLAEEYFGKINIDTRITKFLRDVMDKGGLDFRLVEESAPLVLELLVKYPKKPDFERHFVDNFGVDSLTANRALIEDVFSDLHTNPIVKYLFEEAA